MGSGQIRYIYPKWVYICHRTWQPCTRDAIDVSPPPIWVHQVPILFLSCVVTPFLSLTMKEGNGKPPSLYSQENIMALSNAKFSVCVNSLPNGFPGGGSSGRSTYINTVMMSRLFRHEGTTKKKRCFIMARYCNTVEFNWSGELNQFNENFMWIYVEYYTSTGHRRTDV